MHGHNHSVVRRRRTGSFHPLNYWIDHVPLSLILVVFTMLFWQTSHVLSPFASPSRAHLVLVPPLPTSAEMATLMPPIDPGIRTTFTFASMDTGLVFDLAHPSPVPLA